MHCRQSEADLSATACFSLKHVCTRPGKFGIFEIRKPVTMLNETLANELIQLADDDLSVREKLLADGKLSDGYHPDMEAVHKFNAKRLREIIASFGYPGISKVGEKASNAAWLIVQHAIGEPDFMQECYRLMVENKADVNPANIAYLCDRIQVFKSKPQQYGTQLVATDIIYPVENRQAVNEERSKMNLPPLSQEQINRIPDPEQIPELDLQQEGYQAWRKKVGWI